MTEVASPSSSVSGIQSVRSPSKKSSAERERIQLGTWRSCFWDGTNHSMEPVVSLPYMFFNSSLGMRPVVIVEG